MSKTKMFVHRIKPGLGLSLGALALTISGHLLAEPPSFEVVDLGTLGGAGGEALGLNNLGQIVGYAGTGDRYRSGAFIYADSVMRPLGSMPSDGSSTFGYAINEGGVAIVQYQGGGAPISSYLVDGVREVPITGLTTSRIRAYDINNAGLVVGYYLTESNAVRAFSWTEDGGMVDLTVTGGGAFSVNVHGQIVGSSNQGAFIYEADNIAILSDGVHLMREAWGINDAGTVVGSTFDSTGRLIGAIFSDSRIEILDIVGATQVSGQALNNHGHVIGNYYGPTQPWSSFFYYEGEIFDINDLLADGYATDWRIGVVWGINDDGHIVGTGRYADQSERPVVLVPKWKGTPPRELLCRGSGEGLFQPPADQSVSISRPNRILPLRMQLVNEDEQPDDALESPPVLQISVVPGNGEGSSGVEVNFAGRGDEGNTFTFDGSQWGFNWQTRGLAPGVYTLTVVSGDSAHYRIIPTCSVEVSVR